ncbi:HNH endonuclease [Candidatus Pacearchaeota archaeon]|nr:HNH endonuclease [Candidatus Pacearchaeota archaeon]
MPQDSFKVPDTLFDPDKTCTRCGESFVRLEDENKGAFKRRIYCSDECNWKHKEETRPPGWKKSHYESRKLRGDSCEACGLSDSLHAHHVDGNPDNNNPENIQTLCRWCHAFRHALSDRLDLDEPGKMPKLVEVIYG